MADMGVRSLWPVAVVVMLLPFVADAQSPGDPQSPTAKFKSAVDVVSVSAVVRDRKGRFVRDLAEKDFVVADGGEPRPILDFRAEADGPVKLALLVDVSGSMRVGSKAVDARQAARHLFSALRPADEAAVFAFDTRLQRVSAFTADLASLDAALDHVDPPYGQTSLYDAVAETARAVADQGNGRGRLPQRSAVVVLTDGVDTRSRMTAEQVSAVASSIDIPVYIVAVMSSIDDPRNAADPAARDADTPLGSLARWTGGELFTASAPAHASLAARQIIDELRHQYVLAFEASAKPGWRPLDVRARDGGLTVRARAGYVVGGASHP
jgi:VWFA-related protein